MAYRIGVTLAIGLWLGACAGTDSKDTADDTDVGQAPLATIVLPADGAVVNTPDAVNLRGTGVDAEDGDLPGASLSWRSDVDGDLGTGLGVVTVLQPGPHEITLTVTDSAGQTGTDRVSIRVTAENEAPVVEIREPDDGAYVREGEVVRFAGVGTDLEDGDLRGPSLLWTSDRDGLLGASRALDVPQLSIGDHLIVLTAVDSQGAEASTAITLHVVGVGVDTPPTTTIDQPADGASFVLGDAVRFEGHASDLEDGALTGLVWSSSLQGALGAGDALDVSDLIAGLHTVTATATDSAGQPGVDAVTLTINAPGNQAPTAAIDEPAANASFEAGDVVHLAGRASDPEDGALRGPALSWTSSLDGALGTGASLDVTTLTVGSHTLQLLATDSAGAVGVASTSVFIVAANAAPSAQITAPANGSHALVGGTVNFAGTGADAEDGVLTGASLLWSSNLDGSFGTGESRPFASLSAGAHQITLTAVDSRGAVGTDSIQVVVDPAPVPVPPVASLLGANVGYVGIAWAADASSSVDPDGRVTTYAFDWGDGTPVTRGAASSASHSYAAAGLRMVTLTVTDDDGLTDTATLSVDVQIPIRVPVVVEDGLWPLGNFCAIAVDAANAPQVLYGETGHHQVWWTTRQGGAWVRELVDGPGFGVGGRVAGGGSLVIDSAGVPHGAWLIDNEVHYGTRVGGVWTVEAVTQVARDDGNVAVALDPSHANRPTVAWTDDTSGRVSVAYRTGPGAWTAQTWTNPVGTTGAFRGGMAFTPGGVALLSVGSTASGVVSWQQAGGFSGFQLAWDDYYSERYVAPVVVDAAREPLVLWESGLEHRVAGAWVHDDVSNTALTDVDLAWDATIGQPVALFRNDQGLVEIVRPEGRAYWDWEYQGEVDAGVDPGLVIDSAGDARACFFRSGNLVVY